MLVVSCYYSSFLKILKSSAVTSFFHEKQLFSIPSIEIDRLDKGIADTVLTVLPCAVEAKMNAKVDRRPLGILFFAVQAHLTTTRSTLLSLRFLICRNTLSLVSSSTIYISKRFYLFRCLARHDQTFKNYIKKQTKLITC